MDDAGTSAAKAQLSFAEQAVDDIDIGLFAPIDELSITSVANDK